MAECPLTFDEAMRLDLEQLHKQRRFAFDVETWDDRELSFNSDNINVSHQTPRFDSMIDDKSAPKVSMASIILSPLVCFFLPFFEYFFF